jgi:hypothetical protein
MATKLSFFDKFKPALIEGIKELLRVVVLAIIPVAISNLEQSKVIDWRAIGVVAGIAVLRFADKVMHEWGKILDDESIIKGLTRF